GRVWLLGDGGGSGIAWESVPLKIDEPQGRNPLAKPLKLAILSGPIPPQGEVRRWISVDVRPEEPPATGKRRGRFLPQSRGEGRSLDELAVDSPQLLEGGGAIQMLIELEVPPGAVWDPPWIDSVRLSWEPPERGAPR